MQSSGRQLLRFGVKEAVNDIGADYVCAEWVRIPQEVGESDCWEAVVVGKGLGVEFDHCNA
jgi:hypothetical protein